MPWNDDGSFYPISTCFTGIEELAAALGAAGATAGAAPIVTTAALAPAAAAAAGGGASLAAVPIGAGILSSIPEVIGTAGSIVGAGSTIAGTVNARQAAEQGAQTQAAALTAKAASDRAQANLDAATAQRDALNERRRTSLVQSQLQARAAAGGGDTTDPSVLALGEGIAGQGEYNALQKLAAGQTREAALNYQSTLDQAQAGRYLQAGDIGSRAALYSGLGTLSTQLARSRYLFPRGAAAGGGLFGGVPGVDY